VTADALVEPLDGYWIPCNVLQGSQNRTKETNLGTVPETNQPPAIVVYKSSHRRRAMFFENLKIVQSAELATRLYKPR